MCVQNYFGLYDYSDRRVIFLPPLAKVRESPLTTFAATLTVNHNKAGGNHAYV